MNLPQFNDKNKVNAADLTKLKMNIEKNGLDKVAADLIQDIRKWGVRLPENLSITFIRTGDGDTICFILNDLLNRELIRKNFKFLSHLHIKNQN